MRVGPREAHLPIMRKFLVLGLVAAGAEAFAPSNMIKAPSRQGNAASIAPARAAVMSRPGLCAARMMAATPDPARVIKESSEDAELAKKKIENGRFYSIPPSVATMFLDNEEYFHLVQGRATITPVTVTGKPLGDDVQFEEGDYGVVPGGSYRWTAQKQVTKQTSCREGLQMATKGWREEPPLEAMRGKGTLSTIGRQPDDDLKYLKELIAEKGAIPESAFEKAIQYKLDRDIYLATLSFGITDKGLMIMERTTEKVLAVLDGNGDFSDYNPDLEYLETEGSKRWRIDGNFDRNIMMNERKK